VIHSGQTAERPGFLLKRVLVIFQCIRIVLITRAQYELAACGWLFIEDVPKVKAVRR